MKYTMIVVLMMITSCSFAESFISSWGLEAGAVTSLFPSRDLQVGGAIGVKLGVLPDSIPLLGGRKYFGDFLLVTGEKKAAIGISGSINKAEEDNGLRLGAGAYQKVNGGRELEYMIYLRNAFSL